MKIPTEAIMEVIIIVRDWAITSLPGLLLIILLAIIALKLVDSISRRLEKVLHQQANRNKAIDPSEAGKRITTLVGIARRSIRTVLWFTLIMLALQRVGINVAPLLASAGIAGLAVGFGAQELVRDVITGFFMLLENHLRIGDVVTINGTSGAVESIELRTTTLRDLSGVVHIFQNGKIQSLSNLTKDWSAIILDIGVGYQSDTAQVASIMQAVGDEMLQDPEWSVHLIAPVEVLGLEEFADSALVMRVRIKTRPIQQWAAGREYRRRLKLAFDRENIEIPFPKRSVYLENSQKQ